MKKLLYTLFVLIGMTSMSYAQTANNVAVAQSEADLAKAKISGVYTFGIPGDKTTEEVGDRAKFYTNYFTVAFDEASDVATVTLVENTAANRTIIARFLMSSGLRMVKVEDKEMKVLDFTADYLK